MKLYLTLEDNDKLKVERVVQILPEGLSEIKGLDGLVNSMIDSIKKLKDEEIRVEAQRLVQNDKAND